MPRLRVCSRHINSSSDDYVYSSFLSACVRALWASVAFSLLLYPSTTACTPLSTLKGSLSVAVCCLALFCLLLDIALIYTSSRGLPLDPRGREWVPCLLTARISTLIFEVSLGGLCIAAALGSPPFTDPACDNPQSLASAWFAASIIIVVGAGLSVLGFVCLFSCSFLFGGVQRRWGALLRAPDSMSPGAAEEAARLVSSALWERRVRGCGCGCPGNVNAAASLLQLEKESGGRSGVGKGEGFMWQVLGDGLSVVTSSAVNHDLTLCDICAGGALHYRGPSQPRGGPPATPYNPKDAIQLAALEEAKHFMIHTYAGMSDVSMALDYGVCFPLVLGSCAVGLGVRDCTALLLKSLCGTSSSSGSGGGSGGSGGMNDGRDALLQPSCLCDLHSAGVRGTLWNHPQITLLHTNPKRLAAQLPFIVTLDHQRKAVVVSFRGTLYGEDVLTDGLALKTSVWETEEGPGIRQSLIDRGWWGVGGGGVEEPAFVHTGFWLVARQARQELDTLPQVQKCAAGGGSTPYTLVITGHSLGAGVAALLALQLLPRFPTVRAYAYGIPSATTSLSLARALSPLITSVVLGRDLVATMTLTNAKNTMDGISQALEKAPSSKASFMLPVWVSTLVCCLPWRVRVALGAARENPGGEGLGRGVGTSPPTVDVNTSASPLLAASSTSPTSLEGTPAAAATPPATAFRDPLTPHATRILEDFAREMGVPGRVLHLVQKWEGPKDPLSLLLTNLGGALSLLVLLPPTLPFLLLAPLTGVCTAWEFVGGVRGVGEGFGDALAALLWAALGGLCCACSWRVRRGYAPQWVDNSAFTGVGKPVDVSMRGAIEHLPNCYLEALKGV